VRLVERPGVLHFFDGHRVVSVRGDEGGRRAIRQVIGGALRAADHPAGTSTELPVTEPPPAELPPGAAEDARELLTRLKLLDPAAASVGAHGRASAPSVGAQFASAASAGWVGPQLADERLRAIEVHVWDDSGALCAALSASGLRCVPLAGPDRIAHVDTTRGVVAVAAADQRPLHRLRAANAACLRHGVSWLPVGGYDGASVHVGPLMVPGQSACAECLLRRLAANVEYSGVYHEVADAPSAPTPPALRDWSYSMAALILLRWVAGRDAALPGLLLTLAPDELAMRQARVHRVPRCPGCAGPDFVLAPAPWDIARDH
jgi:bacteriocin biosynthesis cyclodehydratase domain-containing protein